MHVFIIAATTKDGFIAKTASQNSMEWTSGADKQFFIERTKKAGVVVMGRKTFETIGKPLKGRKTIVMSRSQYAIPDVEVTNESPQELVERLTHEGYSELAVLGGAQIYEQFIASNLVSTVYITQEPITFGTGIPLLSPEMQQKLSLVSSTNLEGDTVLLEYTVIT